MPKKIHIPEREFFNEETNEFIYTKERIITIEHSLVSISKWEAIWKKSFVNEGPQTKQELLSYIKCMTITQNVDDSVYQCLTDKNILEISEYIDDSMTATTIKDAKDSTSKNGEFITSELVYYWMTAYNIPIDICQKWHFNRLLTLIKVCDAKSQPDKKMSQEEEMMQRRILNEQRKAKHKTRG